MRDYRKLTVWRRAHVLALSVYEATKGFPGAERFGLSAQMRRAAVSIPSNIAEGCGRGTDADFARFVRIAAGSTNELEYQCLLSRDLCYLSQEQAHDLMAACSEVRRMLSGLISTLTQTSP